MPSGQISKRTRAQASPSVSVEPWRLNWMKDGRSVRENMHGDLRNMPKINKYKVISVHRVSDRSEFLTVIEAIDGSMDSLPIRFRSADRRTSWTRTSIALYEPDPRAMACGARRLVGMEGTSFPNAGDILSSADTGPDERALL